MKCTVFRVVVLLIGMASIGMQIVGLLIPAWIRVKVSFTDNDNEKTTLFLNFGLWMVQYCVKSFSNEDECQTVAFQESERRIQDQGGEPVDYSGMRPIQIATVSGGVLCLLGLLFMGLYVRQLDKDNGSKCPGVFGAILWFLGVIPSGGAVALILLVYWVLKKAETIGEEGTNEEDYVDVYFPWAIIFTGIGSFLALITGICLSARMCKRSRGHSGQVMM